MLYIKFEGRERGFMALISAIIMTLIILTVTVLLNLFSFFGRFNILDLEFKEISVGLAEACADRAILNLANNPSYTPAAGGDIILVGSDNCKILSITGASQKTIRAQAIYKDSYTNLKVVVTPLVNTISINSWEEVPHF